VLVLRQLGEVHCCYKVGLNDVAESVLESFSLGGMWPSEGTYMAKVVVFSCFGNLCGLLRNLFSKLFVAVDVVGELVNEKTLDECQILHIWAP
jgi:hypothetical protein